MLNRENNIINRNYCVGSSSSDDLFDYPDLSVRYFKWFYAIILNMLIIEYLKSKICVLFYYIYICVYDMYMSIYTPIILPPRISHYDIFGFIFSVYAMFIYFNFTILALYCIYRLTCFKKSCCKHCFVSSKFSVTLCLMTTYYTII